MVGDAAGFVDVPSLKGIHYAMQSGMYAARAVFAALKAGDVTAASLAAYDRMVDESYIVSDMRRTRNMRLAFKDGLYLGGVKAGLMVADRRADSRRPDRHAGRCATRRGTIGPAEPFMPDNTLTFSKLDAVFKSGNATRDTIPSHLIVGRDVGAEVADFYTHVCPAGVYERVGDELRVNAAELRGLQGDRRPGPPMDPAGGRQRAQVPPDVGFGAGFGPARAAGGAARSVQGGRHRSLTKNLTAYPDSPRDLCPVLRSGATF